jgi:hypothetical protein
MPKTSPAASARKPQAKARTAAVSTPTAPKITAQFRNDLAGLERLANLYTTAHRDHSMNSKISTLLSWGNTLTDPERSTTGRLVTGISSPGSRARGHGSAKTAKAGAA